MAQANNYYGQSPMAYQQVGPQASTPIQAQGGQRPIQPYQVPVQTQPQQKTDSFAITSLVTGLAGLLLFGIILGPIAVVFGALAKKRIKESSGALAGGGMATAGLVLGIVDAAWFFVWASWFLY